MASQCRKSSGGWKISAVALIAHSNPLDPENPLLPLRLALCITSVFAIGLLAGLLVGTGMDHYMAGGLPEAAWVTWRQTRSWVFPAIMPWFFNLTLLLLVAASIVNGGRARWFFAAATVCALVAILVTVRLEVPMNKMISSWTPGAAPANWAAIRDQWLRNHLVRSIAGVLGFLCALGGLSAQ
jgi:hypothetical protein